MFYGNRTYVHRLRSQHILRTQVKSDKIYYCPVCLEESGGYESIQSFHQIKGVLVCPKHHCYLNNIPIIPYQKLTMPEQWNRNKVFCDRDSLLVKIAEDAKYIMENQIDMDNYIFREYLLDEALNRGVCRRVKWYEEESADWRSFYDDLPLEYVPYKDRASFQKFAAYEITGGIEPIEYLLFVRSLYGSFQRFMNQI